MALAPITSDLLAFRAAAFFWASSSPGARNDHRLVRAIVLLFQLLDNWKHACGDVFIFSTPPRWVRRAFYFVLRFRCAQRLPTGFAGGQAMEEQRKAAQTFTEIDDARCKSYGAPGSQGYARCRASLEKERAGSLTAAPR